MQSEYSFSVFGGNVLDEITLFIIMVPGHKQVQAQINTPIAIV